MKFDKFPIVVKHSVLFGCVVASLIFHSCSAESTEIGKEALPASDLYDIFSIDTLKIESYTVAPNEIPETGMKESSFLGKGNDRYFGSTTAEFVSQVRLGSSEFASNFHHVVDSVALNLRVERVTGSTLGPHYLSIYEIADDLSKDSTYYANSTINHTEKSVTNLLLPSLNRTTTDIRITLPSSFGDYLTRNPEALTNSPTVENNFANFFKGVHFVLESKERDAFLEFSLDPPEVALSYYNYFTIYLTDTTNNSPAQLAVILDATNENARFNIFHNNLSTAEQPIPHINDSYLDTLVYIHRWGAVSAQMSIPELESIKNNPQYDNIIVTKARILFPIMTDGENYTKETVPNKFFLKYLLKDGTKEYVHDYSLVSSEFYWGTLNNANYVEFNIPTFVQAYLEDDTNTILPTFELSLLQSSLNSSILKSNNNSVPPIFELTFVRNFL